MKKKKKLFEAEQEMEKKEADGDNGGATADHSDEEQDKALFAKMIKQYLGKEEPDEMEMEMAKQAYQAHKEKGMEGEAAMEAAGKHLQMAAEIGKKMQQAMEKKECGEKEAGEDEVEAEKETEKEADEEKPEGVKESARRVAKLSGEVAKLREALKKYELTNYLDSKLKKSGESNVVTKMFREALGTPRNEKHIDETWTMFIKAYKAGAEEVSESDSAFFMEKQTAPSNSDGKKFTFTDCLS